MANLDETIKGLECCAERFPRNKKCGECPYVSICYHDRACDELLTDALELLKEKQGISVDAFLQWCIESHRMGDALRKGIEYWINEFKTWKQK